MPMTLKHTKGPWKVDRGAASIAYKGDPYQVVSLHGGSARYVAKVDAVKGSEYDEPQNEANAKLIAAAPELLNMLHLCSELLDDYADVNDWEDGPIPNRAMSLGEDVRRLLERIEG